eukprot:968955-Alexandrium_andersonii.AAC.1
MCIRDRLPHPVPPDCPPKRLQRTSTAQVKWAKTAKAAYQRARGRVCCPPGNQERARDRRRVTSFVKSRCAHEVAQTLCQRMLF